MKTLVENVKSLAAPKRFIGLTFRKKIVGYVMLVMLLAVLLAHVLPTYAFGTIPKIIDEVEEICPEFQYKNGKLDYDSGREFSYQNDQTLFYICTGVESFSTQYGTANYFGNYVDMSRPQELPPQIMMFSKTNYVMVQNQTVNLIPLSQLMNEFNITSLNKAQLLDSLDAILNIVFPIGFVFIFLFSVIGIFFFALIWGLIAYLINRTQKISYTYGRMYRLAVYVMVPMRVLRMLCTQWLPLPSSLFAWLFRGLILLYLVLALFMDENQKNIIPGSPYTSGNPNTPDAPAPDPYESTNRF